MSALEMVLSFLLIVSFTFIYLLTNYILKSIKELLNDLEQISEVSEHFNIKLMIKNLIFKIKSKFSIES